jgi:hypothetical protein
VSRGWVERKRERAVGQLREGWAEKTFSIFLKDTNELILV